jgi:hypothetical protein
MRPYVDMFLFFVAFFAGMFCPWFLARGQFWSGYAFIFGAWVIYFTAMALQRRKDRAA